MEIKEQVLRATHQGKLKIGNIELNCAVLNDGTRVISKKAIYTAFGRTMSGRRIDDVRVRNMPTFVDAKNLQSFIDGDLHAMLKPIKYFDLNNKSVEGYRAEILPSLCDVYLNARVADVLAPKQLSLAAASEILVRAFAKVGIIALVDEATGFQDKRVKNALELILNKFLLEEAKKYEVTFPLQLYKEWFRLNGWEWRPENAQKRPKILGKWTNQYIYARMAPHLLDELKRRNPRNEKGNLKDKHFQYLTDDIGEPRLREFFGGHLALAKASMTWKKYIRLVERAYPLFGDQIPLFEEEEDK